MTIMLAHHLYIYIVPLIWENVRNATNFLHLLLLKQATIISNIFEKENKFEKEIIFEKVSWTNQTLYLNVSWTNQA